MIEYIIGTLGIGAGLCLIMATGSIIEVIRGTKNYAFSRIYIQGGISIAIIILASRVIKIIGLAIMRIL
jgi:hypothetical protein